MFIITSSNRSINQLYKSGSVIHQKNWMSTSAIHRIPRLQGQMITASRKSSHNDREFHIPSEKRYIIVMIWHNRYAMDKPNANFTFQSSSNSLTLHLHFNLVANCPSAHRYAVPTEICRIEFVWWQMVFLTLCKNERLAGPMHTSQVHMKVMTTLTSSPWLLSSIINVVIWPQKLLLLSQKQCWALSRHVRSVVQLDEIQKYSYQHYLSSSTWRNSMSQCSFTWDVGRGASFPFKMDFVSKTARETMSCILWCRTFGPQSDTHVSGGFFGAKSNATSQSTRFKRTYVWSFSARQKKSNFTRALWGWKIYTCLFLDAQKQKVILLCRWIRRFISACEVRPMAPSCRMPHMQFVLCCAFVKHLLRSCGRQRIDLCSTTSNPPHLHTSIARLRCREDTHWTHRFDHCCDGFVQVSFEEDPTRMPSRFIPCICWLPKVSVPVVFRHAAPPSHPRVYIRGSHVFRSVSMVGYSKHATWRDQRCIIDCGTTHRDACCWLVTRGCCPRRRIVDHQTLIPIERGLQASTKSFSSICFEAASDCRHLLHRDQRDRLVLSLQTCAVHHHCKIEWRIDRDTFVWSGSEQAPEAWDERQSNPMHLRHLEKSTNRGMIESPERSRTEDRSFVLKISFLSRPNLLTTDDPHKIG